MPALPRPSEYSFPPRGPTAQKHPTDFSRSPDLRHGKKKCLKGRLKNGKCITGKLRVRNVDSAEYFEIPDVEDAHWEEEED